jgi:hypothetical protein
VGDTIRPGRKKSQTPKRSTRVPGGVGSRDVLYRVTVFIGASPGGKKLGKLGGYLAMGDLAIKSNQISLKSLS